MCCVSNSDAPYTLSKLVKMRTPGPCRMVTRLQGIVTACPCSKTERDGACKRNAQQLPRLRH